ncbi:MAG: c-type cytochrome [Candidatus Methylomirabilales bacterium]
MTRRSFFSTFLFLILGLWAIPALAGDSPGTSADIARGRAIFNRSCIFCHGAQGQGDGPAAFFIASYGAPRPQNFTGGQFKCRSTPSGAFPTDLDLFRTLTEGIPGFMPSFAGLTEQERWQVISYLKGFHPKFRQPIPAPIEIGPPFPSSPESISRGRQLYREAGCVECHGEGGRGDGEKADTLQDYRGLSIPAADVTNLTSFKCGNTPVDIYRGILTGLNGTPMPSYQEAFPGGDQEIWHLVNYILSLSKR